MSADLHELRQDANRLASALARVRTNSVNKGADRAAFRQLVDDYFRACRPALESLGIDQGVLGEIDDAMQGLLRHTQGRSLKSAYRSSLNRARKALDDAEVQAVARFPADARGVAAGAGGPDAAIVETLGKALPTAAASYLQGLRDMQGPDRVSWRGTAAEFRESLREVLHHLAPDEQVKAQTGFKPDSRPTMRQRTRFILRSRRRPSPAIEDAVDVVEDAVGGFVRSVYEESSGSSHGEPGRADVERVHRFVRTALAELLMVS